MHSVLALEEAIGIITFHINSNRLDSRLVTIEDLGDGCLIAVTFRITQIQAHQHLRPVLTLCAAGTGVDFEHHAELVFLAPQHIAEFKTFEFLDHSLILLVYFLLRHEFLLHKIKGELKFLHLLFKRGVGINPEMKLLDLAHLSLSLIPVVPEVSDMRAQFLLLDFDSF